MYVRHTTLRKNGKAHTYWRRVRSVRRGGKVVQETVATLGELDTEGHAKARALAQQMGTRAAPPGLFDAPAMPGGAVPVHLDKIRLERPRDFGAVWLGWTLWRALRLDEFLERAIPKGREDVPWPQMAAVLVLARLCEPSSELHIAEDWYRKTALEDLLGIAAEKVNENRLYRGLDALLPHKVELEKHLRARLGELFDVSYDLHRPARRRADSVRAPRADQAPRALRDRPEGQSGRRHVRRGGVRAAHPAVERVA